MGEGTVEPRTQGRHRERQDPCQVSRASSSLLGLSACGRELYFLSHPHRVRVGYWDEADAPQPGQCRVLGWLLGLRDSQHTALPERSSWKSLSDF